ncbi:MAG: pyrroline-5-carboxylate reductase [Lachnospiraceae bacterium]|nr:pyrroline-5-carboxylate reductase [Lachnospiraceae bacterium]
MKIGFIGLGNMAGAIIGGLIKKGEFAAADICGADVNAAMAAKRKEEFGITILADNNALVKSADIVVLAVKPQFAGEVIAGIKDDADEKLFISIVAGKTLAWYEEQFGKKVKVVRCMPNTAALVSEAMTAVTPADTVSKEETDTALRILESFGKASVVPEHLMDAVVGVSGSAPAYVFMFLEAMADAAVAMGMPRNQAYEFAGQAVLGSAKLMLETGKHPGELKDMVCSPAGTTIEAVKVLEEKNFRGAVIDAVIAAAEKSKKL